jgi:hypothetical protein
LQAFVKLSVLSVCAMNVTATPTANDKQSWRGPQNIKAK